MLSVKDSIWFHFYVGTKTLDHTVLFWPPMNNFLNYLINLFFLKLSDPNKLPIKALIWAKKKTEIQEDVGSYS